MMRMESVEVKRVLVMANRFGEGKAFVYRIGINPWGRFAVCTECVR